MKKHIELFDVVEDPLRVRTGDVVIVRDAVRNRLDLTPSTLSRYGVSHGSTSRSENYTDTLKRLYTDRVTAGDAAYVVQETRTPGTYGSPTLRKYQDYFGNAAGLGVVHDEPRARGVRLVPVSVQAVSALVPADPADAFALSEIAGVTLVARALEGGGGILETDVHQSSRFNRIGAEGRLYDVLDQLNAIPTQLAAGHTIAVRLHDATAEGKLPFPRIEQAVSAALGEHPYNKRKDSIVFPAKALTMLASRGAVTLRPTSVYKVLLANALAYRLAADAKTLWSSLDAAAKKAARTLDTDRRLVYAARARSWALRTAKLSKGTQLASRTASRSFARMTVKGGAK